MAFFEVSKQYIEQFIDVQIEKNEDFKEYRDELIDILINNDPDIVRDTDEEEWPYEKKEPTQLYVRDSRYHIRIKDLVIDFFENIFTGFLLEPMLSWFGVVNGAGVAVVGVTSSFVFFLKRVVKEYIVKLDGVEFCLYLQVITHLKEHDEFTIADLKGWLPKSVESACNMRTDKWNCPKRTQGICQIDTSQMENVLQRMVSKNIIDYSENGAYKIRF